jgi:NDP-sugar pyrophosphorylase family protein
VESLAGWPVAVLAGGLATRLRPLTANIPKALLPVADRPFVFHQLRLLRDAGFRSVVFCIGYLGEQIQALLGDGRTLGLELAYSYDGTKLLGTGGALKQALNLLGERFVVLYGDSYLPIDYSAIVSAFAQSGKPALMTVFRNDGHWDASNVWFEAGEIRCYNKQMPTPEMHYIDYGASVLSRPAFASFGDREVFDLADLYQHLVKKEEMAGYETKRRFYEIGSPDGLAELDALLRADAG